MVTPKKKTTKTAKAPKEAKVTKAAKPAKEKVLHATNARTKDFAILLEPVITEKASMVGGDRTRSVFRVAPDSTKPEIREAIERIFGVKVESIRTCNVLGKVKRTGMYSGRRKSTKKAYITLKAGQTLDVVEGV